jgi:hypothetical protein
MTAEHLSDRSQPEDERTPLLVLGLGNVHEYSMAVRWA